MDTGAEADETEVVIHRLITPPTRWGPDDANLMWTEVEPDGDAVVRFWIPDGEADRARLEAFWQACQEIDWDDVRVHEVPATEVKRRAFTLPTPTDPPPRREGPPPEFTDQGLIRRVPHDPAPVAESWRRIEAWMSRHCPEVVVSLLPGASEQDIAGFEAVIGRELPEDVKASYRIHDGLGHVPFEYVEMLQGDDDDAPEPDLVNSVFYDYGLDSIRERRECNEILTQWRIGATLDTSEHVFDEYGDRQVFPHDAIQIRDHCRGWIPLFSDHGNCLGIDLAPGPTGVVGQVINFGVDEGDRKFVLATSWAQFLEDYADELEAGNFAFQGEPGDGHRDLWMKRPKEASICHHWRSWAEAKLDPAFQDVGKPPESEPIPADPETERECRAVVDGFIADYRAWERRWLAIRPVGELGFREVGERADGEFWCAPYSSKDLIRKGLPVPEAVAHIEKSGNSYNEILKDEWLRAHLQVGVHHGPAMDERRAIFARYTTAWARRSQSDNFILNESPRFDPEDYVDAMVFRADDLAYVWSIRGDANQRFLLKREGGDWRIERLQVQRESNKPFLSKTLV